MPRYAILKASRPVQFFAEAETHAAAVARLKEESRRRRTRLTLTDHLRACLADLAEGRVSLVLEGSQDEGKTIPPQS